MAKELVLALGGGGMRGIAHIGVIKCLLDNGYKIKGIAGTSAGGMFGALYASGASLRTIDNLISRYSEKPSFDWRSSDGEASLLGLGFIEKLLKEVLEDKLIEDFPIKFLATAVNLDKEREVVFSSGLAMDAVLATIAIPGILPPRGSEDGLLIDGGVLDPVPVGLARQIDPSVPVVAVCLSKKNWEDTRHRSLLPFEGLVPKPISERLAKNRYVEAFTIYYRALEIMNDRISDANLLLEEPDLIVAPLVGHYHALDVEIPDDLEMRGYQAMQKEMEDLEKAFSLANTVKRIAKYTERSKEIKPTVELLTPPEEGDKG